jgi:hypothetical protein
LDNRKGRKCTVHVDSPLTYQLATGGDRTEGAGPTEAQREANAPASFLQQFRHTVLPAAGFNRQTLEDAVDLCSGRWHPVEAELAPLFRLNQDAPQVGDLSRGVEVSTILGAKLNFYHSHNVTRFKTDKYSAYLPLPPRSLVSG